MDFTHDVEQEALRDSVRGLLGRSYGSFEQRRKAVDTDPGFDESLWERLAELGVLGLAFDEEHGGMGAGPVEVALVAEEIGRVLAPEPFLSGVVLAGGLVAAAGDDEQRSRVLSGLSEGSLLPTFAHLEPGGRWTDEASAVTAEQSPGEEWRLSGVKEPVPHGARADLLVVSAALPAGGTGLFLVDDDADGLVRNGYPIHDGGRAARVGLDATPATPLGTATDRTDVVARVLDEARVAACHEAVGAMSVALTGTTEYLTSRRQFGVTLNKFQALTFRAADMYVSLEMARSVALWATLVLADGDDATVSDAAARASLTVSRAGRHIGQEAIQLHGGIGMTAEYSIGHYASHLTALEHLLGDGHHHLTRLAATVGDHGEVDPIP